MKETERTGLECEGKVGIAALLEGLEADESCQEEEPAHAGAARQGGGAAAAEVAQQAAGQDREPVGDREAEVVHLRSTSLSDLSRSRDLGDLAFSSSSVSGRRLVLVRLVVCAEGANGVFLTALVFH